MGKSILFSSHAKLQMLLRGAEENEVIATIQTRKWESAKYNKSSCRAQFYFEKPSQVNQKIYKYKTIEAIFVEEDDKIVVITVKVYYHN